MRDKERLQVAMGNTETLNTFKMFYDNLRRIQRLKIVFCRSLRLSNIQICYPR